MWDETGIFMLPEREEEGGEKIRIMKTKNSVPSQQRVSIFKRTEIDEVIYYWYHHRYALMAVSVLQSPQLWASLPCLQIMLLSIIIFSN